MKKNYNILSNEKFNKLNKAQKKSVVLKSLSALTLIESSLVFATSGVMTLVTKEPTIVPALLFVNTGITAGMSLMAYKDAIRDNAKNTKMVNGKIRSLNDRIIEAESKLYLRK